MGRLRNLSESFKAAAFPSASTASSPNSQSRTLPQSPVGPSEQRDNTGILREDSQSSTSQSASAARPNSMIYTPPTLVQANDEIEELKPVFSYLSSHANKLYQEGYFLKLDDLDTNGKPNPNRVWTECFAQLVGTILSFWDAEALDAAGQDGEVAPSFINLSDASIKMIETLPTRNEDVQPLQNVLSISTAGKNRYLLHFNSLHSLTQWTAGIRLAMFETASLQELYTGSLIAGKGRTLNSINHIMTKNKYRIEDWARVRFGAGTPWRRCWCVIEPPDEKEWQRSQKKIGKKSAYEKTSYPKGDIKFYDTKKIKKALPIATITDAYSAYAIYPQSKPLINDSTLIKLEGKITIHSQPESKTEGFVFVMPDVHPAVSGFEMMLRWLLPVYDTFSLYGRPNRLIPDTLDTRSLMFAMPKERRYGYLDIIDIAALIHTDGSDKWSEREWRKKMKEGVSRRMSMQTQGRASNVEQVRHSMSARPPIQFSDSDSIHSIPMSQQPNISTDAVFETPKKTHTAPVLASQHYHARSASENINLSPMRMRDPANKSHTPTRLSEEHSPSRGSVPMPPNQRQPLRPRVNDVGYTDSANSSDSEMYNQIHPEDVTHDMIQQKPVQPVVAPPSFQHQPNELPKKRPADRPEMRREKSRMSDATLAHMNPRVLEELRREDAARSEGLQTQGFQEGPAASAAAYAWRQNGPDQSRGVTEAPADTDGTLANSHRPAVVTNSSSMSIQSSLRRKPLVSADVVTADNIRPPFDRNHSETSNYSVSQNTRDSSPDYAGRAFGTSSYPAAMEKLRGGTRKVVGDAETQEPSNIDGINVDFGQTLRLTPENSRPNTAGGRRSPFDSLGRPGSATGRRSPFDSLGQPSAGRKSPLNPLESSSPARTPEKQTPRERPSHSRSQSYAWQPGTQVRDGSPAGLSAEEFVQQRAVMAMRPQSYVAHRTLSSGRVEQLKNDPQPRASSPTSPRRLQKRNPPSRQSSGASVDYSAHLSAREQEHVAKMTGGPLLNMNQQTRNPDPGVGLIGAISAREQERQDIKAGLQGRMVQAAIDQRQRESRSHQPQQAQQYQGMWAPQAQHMVQQQYQSQNPYQYPNQYQQPLASDYVPQQMPQPYQAYGNSMQQPQPMSQPSIYAPQLQQHQQVQRTDSQVEQGYPPRPAHSRAQSSYTQYGGFYAPQGR